MKTTFSRTFTAITVLIVAAMVILGISFQLLVSNFLTDSAMEELKEDGETIVELVQAYVADGPINDRDFGIALSVAASVSDADAVICNSSGKLICCARDPLGCSHVGMQLTNSYMERVYSEGGMTDTGVIRGLYEDKRYVVSLPIYAESGQPLGIVLVSSPFDTTQLVMNRITEIYVFLSVLVVVVAVVVMTILLRQQSTPLKAMAKAARDFGHGELTARVKTNGKCTQEVEDLALAFNNMASSLQKSEYQRQEFIANVSHELKTPMTTISGFVDGILDGTIPPEKAEKYLLLVSDETKRLNRLVRSMLDISQLQDKGGIPPEQKTRFDLAECVGQVLITFERKITDKKLAVDVNMPELPVYTMANQDYITQVVYNLLDNAVKFCPEGKKISLEVTTGRNKAYVRVSNEGATIPPEELPLVFDRFHKTDKSRSQNRDSWGLGLHIVKTIVGAHGENISVTSRDGKTVFTFTLPVVN
ncbi:MAG: HAMP domain-containing histidine kinase [Ruminococcaceae bacterium]|nr:HAMP domain-containing histidine kinase [Oscillospiraceae bacterium]